MNKAISYIAAVIGCLVYWILFTVILVSTGRSFEQLGILWQTVFLGLPLFTIWKLVTSLSKKTENKKIETPDDDSNLDNQKSTNR